MSTPDPIPTEPIATVDAPRGRLLPLALAAGVVAGLAAWLAGEASLTAFRPPLTRGVVFGQEIFKASFADQARADARNATLAYAELGAALGLALGLAGGIVARRPARSTASAAAIGAIAGAGLAFAAASVALPFYFHAKDVAAEELSRDMVLPLMVHAGSWSALGLAGGLALGIGLGVATGGGRARAGRTALGGLIGAVVGAVIYELIGGMLFEVAKTDEPVSRTWATRLLARMAVAVMVGLMAAALAEGAGKGRRPPGPVEG